MQPKQLLFVFSTILFIMSTMLHAKDTKGGDSCKWAIRFRINVGISIYF